MGAIWLPGLHQKHQKITWVGKKQSIISISAPNNQSLTTKTILNNKNEENFLYFIKISIYFQQEFEESLYVRDSES